MFCCINFIFKFTKILFLCYQFLFTLSILKWIKSSLSMLCSFFLKPIKSLGNFFNTTSSISWYPIFCKRIVNHSWSLFLCIHSFFLSKFLPLCLRFFFWCWFLSWKDYFWFRERNHISWFSIFENFTILTSSFLFLFFFEVE